MPSITVNIQPEILAWVLNQKDNSFLDTALLSNIQQWLNGTKTPTFNQIEELSRKSRIPLGYFFLNAPPKEEIKLLEYRTVDSIALAEPSRELIDVISEMESVQMWMSSYRQELGFGKCSIVGSANKECDAIALANQIRADMGLVENWYEQSTSASDSFTYIRELLNDVGVLTMMNGVVRNNTRRALSVDEFRAFAMIDDWAPLIFINAVDAPNARLFSLMHELTHIWLGANDLFNDRQVTICNVSSTETLCNAVAGELLVPLKYFNKCWDACLETDVFEQVANISRTFNCSMTVIARKALDNNKISNTTYNAIAKRVIEGYKAQKAENKSLGGNYYNTMRSRLDRSFVRAICESVAMGRTSYTEAFRLTNTNKGTFPDVVSRVGGVSAW